jgi:hypothetical protein
MSALVSFLIFVAFVVLICVVVYWALSVLLSQISGMPPAVIVVLQVIIVLVALLLIIQRGWPLISGYTT